MNNTHLNKAGLYRRRHFECQKCHDRATSYEIRECDLTNPKDYVSFWVTRSKLVIKSKEQNLLASINRQ